jgi:pimeloyl-ACP methyl ester carboxylesterase
MPIDVRTYGDDGPPVFVLHGGPGAPGHMAPVARALSDRFRVFEPLQRRADDRPLTVARHVADLHEAIHLHSPGTRPALVGASWGAMLAMAYAAAHPESAGPVVLIGSGTYETRARARLLEILAERITPAVQEQLDRTAREHADPDEALRAQGRLYSTIYNVDPLDTDDENLPLDARGHHETDADWARLRESGVYPAAFASITSPVLMLHGAYDPHPGALIRDSLLPFVPQLEYHEWPNAGHDLWLELSVRDDFFAVLGDWLTLHLPAAAV